MKGEGENWRWRKRKHDKCKKILEDRKRRVIDWHRSQVVDRSVWNDYVMWVFYWLSLLQLCMCVFMSLSVCMCQSIFLSLFHSLSIYSNLCLSITISLFLSYPVLVLALVLVWTLWSPRQQFQLAPVMHIKNECLSPFNWMNGIEEDKMLNYRRRGRN